MVACIASLLAPIVMKLLGEYQFDSFMFSESPEYVIYSVNRILPSSSGG